MAIIVHSDVKRITVLRGSGRSQRRQVLVADTSGPGVAERAAAAAVEPEEDRRVELVVVGRPKRRQSRALRPLEKLARRAAEREQRAAIVYLTLHERSNRRRTNGWLKDLGKNLMKAVRRSRR